MDDSKIKNQMKTDESSDESSSDSDTFPRDIKCRTCDLNFLDIKTYNNHVKGKKHKRTVDQQRLISKLVLSDKEKMDESESDDENADSNEMYCEVCDRYMSGYIPYMTHTKGNLHAKNVKKQKLKEKMRGMTEVLDKEYEEDGKNYDDVIERPFAHCSKCKKSFSGPEPFQMHLKSATHKKKVQQAEALEVLKMKHPDEAKSEDEDVFNKCSVCNKSFSGLVPYKIHMQSNTHQKNLEKMKLIEEIKEFYSIAESAYICQGCNKKFTDPKNFKYHFTNNSHEKLKAKMALKEFLTSNPEIAFLTSFRNDDDSNSENESDHSDKDYYLICKLCHVSFSGPESAEDHVKSKRHITLKKEKKLLKTSKSQ